MIQPIDRVIAYSFKAELRHIFLDLLHTNGLKKISDISATRTRNLLIESSVSAFQIAGNRSQCEKAFKTCGLIPFNPKKVMESVYVSDSDSDLELARKQTDERNKMLTSCRLTDPIEIKRLAINFPRETGYYNSWMNEKEDLRIVVADMNSIFQPIVCFLKCLPIINLSTEKIAISPFEELNESVEERQNEEVNYLARCNENPPQGAYCYICCQSIFETPDQHRMRSKHSQGISSGNWEEFDRLDNSILIHDLLQEEDSNL